MKKIVSIFRMLEAMAATVAFLFGLYAAYGAWTYFSDKGNETHIEIPANMQDVNKR